MNPGMLKDALTERMAALPERPLRILLLDDDALFCQLMEKAARGVGIFLLACGSLDEFARLPSHRHFDVVILDSYLGGLTGAHFASVLGDRPVVLISSESIPPPETWPKCVKQFVRKSEGPDAILAEALLVAGPLAEAEEGSGVRVPRPERRTAIVESIRGLIKSGDDAFLREVIDLFLAQSAATLLRLQAAVQKSEAERVERLAQELRASSANVGARGMARWAAILEERARQAKWDRCTAVLRGLETEFQRTRALLEKEDAR